MRLRQVGDERSGSRRKGDVTCRLQHAQPKKQDGVGGEAHRRRADSQGGGTEKDDWTAAQAIAQGSCQRTSNQRGDAEGPQDQANLPVGQAGRLQVKGDGYEEGVEGGKEQQCRRPDRPVPGQLSGFRAWMLLLVNRCSRSSSKSALTSVSAEGSSPLKSALV